MYVVLWLIIIIQFLVGTYLLCTIIKYCKSKKNSIIYSKRMRVLIFIIEISMFIELCLHLDSLNVLLIILCEIFCVIVQNVLSNNINKLEKRYDEENLIKYVMNDEKGDLENFK